MTKILGAFDQGVAPTIACINKATAAFGDFAALVAALQVFVDKHFGPIWGVAAKVVAAKSIPAKAWALVFTDSADVADALGYHDLTPAGLPLSHVFVRTTLDAGELVSVTASHELAEMLIDPGIQLGAQGPKGLWYAYETADAVEQLSFSVNGIPMTDFVTPAWFEGFRRPGSTRFDYLGKCSRPYQILRGGYMPVFDPRKGWTQLFGSRAAEKRFARRPHARTTRRILNRKGL